MQKIKSEKGITTIALVITIIIIAVISVPIAVKTAHLQQVKVFTNLRDDLTNLEETISSLYGPDGDISEIGPLYANINTPASDSRIYFLGLAQGDSNVRNVNDNSTYYIIDTKKLSRDLNSAMFSIKLNDLNYGKTCKTLSEPYSSTEIYTGDVTDVYIINEQSRTIYYPDGKKYGDYTYYRLPETYSTIN